jgi:hypothetical protein
MTDPALAAQSVRDKIVKYEEHKKYSHGKMQPKVLLSVGSLYTLDDARCRVW